ncbi:unnamed protein product [Adineta steineri]|uniref:C2HC/C3H-type domain-containing protein n=1 Tax=Adineta steineri TaxID=433720 RepID=A0A818KI70_9BILA|nr:unnamed protein product [Adineta steineri]
MDDDLTEYPTEDLRLQQCQICGRQFNAESLKKHQGICKKVTNKTRRVFDAGKQRATDSDVPYKATKQTAQIYNGEIDPREIQSKSKPKSNWREKHTRLIQSIRQARTVTQAIEQGAPLPVFRPSEVPSDYVACPYCRRNFNEHTAKRHIPFCQTQHERKQMHAPARPNQQVDRVRTVPPQNSYPHKQQSANLEAYSNSHDAHTNGYKQVRSAPMRARRNPAELQLPPQSLPPKTSGYGYGGYQKRYGSNYKEEFMSPANYYEPDDEDNYDSHIYHRAQQPILMRTGRTQEHTTLNVRARQQNGDPSPYMRRIPPILTAPASYSQTQYHYGNGQNNNSTRPTAIGRLPPPPPPVSLRNRCGECGSAFKIASARFCCECGCKR